MWYLVDFVMWVTDQFEQEIKMLQFLEMIRLVRKNSRTSTIVANVLVDALHPSQKFINNIQRIPDKEQSQIKAHLDHLELCTQAS